MNAYAHVYSNMEKFLYFPADIKVIIKRNGNEILSCSEIVMIAAECVFETCKIWNDIFS